jgi:hypothetical protein
VTFGPVEACRIRGTYRHHTIIAYHLYKGDVSIMEKKEPIDLKHLMEELRKLAERLK